MVSINWLTLFAATSEMDHFLSGICQALHTPQSVPCVKGCRSYICMLNLHMVFARVLGLSYNAGSMWFLSFIHSTMCCMLSCWIVARQAPLSMRFSHQECWSGLPCPPSGDLPDTGIERASLCLLHWQVGSLPIEPPYCMSLCVSR